MIYGKTKPAPRRIMSLTADNAPKYGTILKTSEIQTACRTDQTLSICRETVEGSPPAADYIERSELTQPSPSSLVVTFADNNYDILTIARPTPLLWIMWTIHFCFSHESKYRVRLAGTVCTGKRGTLEDKTVFNV
ncbi:hypothetical protein BaRGS_00021022 [Batillaria attramentaria]|uniref:Uncharacterized protein n=1 Tax=Batillaria attramentaria TaxID=370345 RepID=A0ABD0KKQ0_9CAEN